MLMGRQKARADIPCATCDIYLDMRNKKNWLKRNLKKLSIFSILHAVKCKLNSGHNFK
jgi:hypothetical protein